VPNQNGQGAGSIRRKNGVNYSSIIFIIGVLGASGAFAEPWARHTIDNSSRGADGVRLADLNGDGRIDIVTGWEEGGVTRLYLHPPEAKIRGLWPHVSLGDTPSVEDASFVDLDGDGRLDVVTCCEGKQQTVFVHWNIGEKARDWRQVEIPACQKRSRWMYSIGADLDGDGSSELVVGSKNPNGQVSLLLPNKEGDRREVSGWSLKRLCVAGWIMSLELADIDRDGDMDLVVSDRRGPHSGIYWLENSSPVDSGLAASKWVRHDIGLTGEQDVMFLSVVKAKDGSLTIAGCVKPNRCVLFRPATNVRTPWTIVREISYPTDKFGTIKSAAIGKTGDHHDVFISCESAVGAKSGLFMVRTDKSGSDAFHDIAGAEGTKYDRIELVDLDDDGDDDILTCEERIGLGVVWYENPATGINPATGKTD